MQPRFLEVITMSDSLTQPVTAFQAQQVLAAGPLLEVALVVKRASEEAAPQPLLVFDDASGRVIDLDLRGTPDEVRQRLAATPAPGNGRYRPRQPAAAPVEGEEAAPRGRGRPKLGVIAREVTLLPRQWDWLAEQPGGASAVLRRLVDEARRHGAEPQRQRAAQEAAYQFMLAMGGDLPGYEEATRALFAADLARLQQCIEDWPQDIRAYALRLAGA
ncbi:DUF2239 family protein [Pseudomonas protegens]|uniref:DUF2239 family protein n=1 Tax=Pseudomonas protegens TaxID=380021 RepID=UPI000CCFDD2C|nr:DUF2239 family protein [Pseudomonas protegens]POA88936.1 DUF2239 domain-containing protein [Pseudomonas protegens]